jgi:hypothetical protein
MDSANENTYNNTTPPFGNFDFIDCWFQRDQYINCLKTVKKYNAEWIFKHKIISFSYKILDPSIIESTRKEIIDLLNQIEIDPMMEYCKDSSYENIMQSLHKIYREGWNKFYIDKILQQSLYNLEFKQKNSFIEKMRAFDRWDEMKHKNEFKHRIKMKL